MPGKAYQMPRLILYLRDSTSDPLNVSSWLWPRVYIGTRSACKHHSTGQPMPAEVPGLVSVDDVGACYVMYMQTEGIDLLCLLPLQQYKKRLKTQPCMS